MTSIFGDLNDPGVKEDTKPKSRTGFASESFQSSAVPATEVPLHHDEPAERGPKAPRRTNGGVGGSTGRNLRTDWSEAPPVRVPRGRKRHGSTVAVLFLLLLIAGLGWYFYPQLVTSYQYISHLPATEEAMKSLEARADTTEAQLRSLTDNWGSLDQHLNKLDRKVSAGFASARRYVDKEVADAQTQLTAEMNQRAEATNARLDKVESEQADTRTQLAQTQDQFQKEVTALRQQVAELGSHTDQNVARLEQEVGNTQNGIDSLGEKVNRRRVDFEVAQNVTVELAPGVSLTVLKTNASYQSFDGFLSLTNAGKTVWLSSAGVSRAVSFYPEPSDPPYDLVVTRIGAKGVVGYLMVPAAVSQG